MFLESLRAEHSSLISAEQRRSLLQGRVVLSPVNQDQPESSFFANCFQPCTQINSNYSNRKSTQTSLISKVSIFPFPVRKPGTEREIRQGDLVLLPPGNRGPGLPAGAAGLPHVFVFHKGKGVFADLLCLCLN